MQICAFTDCKLPLTDYKSGRFCELHSASSRICGIIPCGRPIALGGPTCNNPGHQAWYVAYCNRFKRLSYPGVRRVIRRRDQHEAEPAAGEPGNQDVQPGAPALEVQLPPLDGIPGHQVVHTFRARTVYCLQTIQWACGMPIGWGKCYKAESQPQVLQIMDRVWASAPNDRPSFMVYDDACDLLRHIVTQDPQSAWLANTKFIVDAWHYTGHRATDVLCRLWCNPAPTNGSQPDLVRVEQDANGEKHLTRAFNTETAEQFNSWLTSYESQMRQMSDVSYDFFMHVLMMLFAERLERQIVRGRRGLEDDDSGNESD